MRGHFSRFIETNIAEASSLTRAISGEIHSIGDGTLVLMGPGFFVNRAMGLGLRQPVAPSHLDEIERCSEATGVPSEIEVCDRTDPSLDALLEQRSYQVAHSVAALARRMDVEVDLAMLPGLEIREVGGASAAAWKNVAALGFGYIDDQQRTISDAFVDAADAVPEIRLLVASIDGHDVAAASLSIRSGTAQLGGMSTDPTHRGRGIQRAMLAHRLRLARDAGCDLAISSATADSQSERNLVRAGFERLTVLRYVRR